MITVGFPLFTAYRGKAFIVIGFDGRTGASDDNLLHPLVVPYLDYSGGDHGEHFTGAPFLAGNDLPYYVHSLEAERAAADQARDLNEAPMIGDAVSAASARE
jgi:hypothetical protein